MSRDLDQGIYYYSSRTMKGISGLGIIAASRPDDVDFLHTMNAVASMTDFYPENGATEYSFLYTAKYGFCTAATTMRRPSGDSRPAPYIHMIFSGKHPNDAPWEYGFRANFQTGDEVFPERWECLAVDELLPWSIWDIITPNTRSTQLAWLIQQLWITLCNSDGSKPLLFLPDALPQDGDASSRLMQVMCKLAELVPPTLRKNLRGTTVSSFHLSTSNRPNVRLSNEPGAIALDRLPELASQPGNYFGALCVKMADDYLNHRNDFDNLLDKIESEALGGILKQPTVERLIMAACCIAASISEFDLWASHEPEMSALANRVETILLNQSEDRGFWEKQLDMLSKNRPPKNLPDLLRQMREQQKAEWEQDSMLYSFYLSDPQKFVLQFDCLKSGWDRLLVSIWAWKQEDTEGLLKRLAPDLYAEPAALQRKRWEDTLPSLETLDKIPFTLLQYPPLYSDLRERWKAAREQIKIGAEFRRWKQLGEKLKFPDYEAEVSQFINERIQNLHTAGDMEKFADEFQRSLNQSQSKMVGQQIEKIAEETAVLEDLQSLKRAEEKLGSKENASALGEKLEQAQWEERIQKAGLSELLQMTDEIYDMRRSYGGALTKIWHDSLDMRLKYNDLPERKDARYVEIAARRLDEADDHDLAQKLCQEFFRVRCSSIDELRRVRPARSGEFRKAFKNHANELAKLASVQEIFEYNYENPGDPLPCPRDAWRRLSLQERESILQRLTDQPGLWWTYREMLDEDVSFCRILSRIFGSDDLKGSIDSQEKKELFECLAETASRLPEAGKAYERLLDAWKDSLDRPNESACASLVGWMDKRDLSSKQWTIAIQIWEKVFEKTDQEKLLEQAHKASGKYNRGKEGKKSNQKIFRTISLLELFSTLNLALVLIWFVFDLSHHIIGILAAGYLGISGLSFILLTRLRQWCYKYVSCESNDLPPVQQPSGGENKRGRNGDHWN